MIGRDSCLFVNCPFDQRFLSLFNAIAFTVTFCGLTVRSALEVSDSGDLRLRKIMRLLETSRYSIHDISRVELEPDSRLPRFNMPIELGIAIGMRELGRKSLRDHCLLVLDSERYRYQKFASDLAGVDIAEHGSRPDDAIVAVREFLSTRAENHVASASVIVDAHAAFQGELPAMAKSQKQTITELNFVDRMRHMKTFLGRAA